MHRILLTNDDGIHSDGLQALEEALLEQGVEVWVVAPLQEMSATSHSITLQRPVRYERLGERKYAVEGTPADAVIVALNKVMKVKPDLVIAGINKGGNMGENVFYSGTLAAAFEARLNRAAAFAISVANHREFQYDVAAAFAWVLAQKLLRDPLPGGTLLNVNVPTPWRNGVRVTRQSRKISKNKLMENSDPRGRKYFWIHEEVDLSQVAPDSDYAAVRDGAISITPLSIDRTEAGAVERLAGWATDLMQFDLAAPTRGDAAPADH